MSSSIPRARKLLSKVLCQPAQALCSAILLCLGLPVGAATTTAEPEVVSAENPWATLAELAALPAYSRPELSDSGRYLAAFGQASGKRTLVVLELENRSKDPLVVGGRGWRMEYFQWLVDDRLLLHVSVPTFFDSVPVTVRRLVLVDPDKGRVDMMFKRLDKRGARQIQDQVLSTLPQNPDQILMQMNPSSPAHAQARIASLKTRNLSRRIEQATVENIASFRADQMGSVRVGYGFTDDQERGVLKLKRADGAWLDYSQYANEYGFRIMALPTSNPDMLYVSSDHEHPLGALYEFFVNTGEFGRKLAHHPESEIARVRMDRLGKSLLAVYFESEFVAPQFFDDWMGSLHEKLGELLPDTHNRILSVTPDRKRAIIHSSASDIDPHYYLLQPELKSLAYLTAQYSHLKQRALAKTTLTSYTARDGLKIRAYVTLPPRHSDDSVQTLPFVVLPHGGPHSRNFLRYDWLTQVIASQGYGVLQMNFRGSTGYGGDFFKAGTREWGQAMQDDITDGTGWLIEQKLADPNRICIAGGSYGGYAALMGVIKEPNLYQCAISLNGVSNLPGLVRLSSRYLGGRYLTRFIGRLWKDRKQLRTNSPLHNADQIKVPVLLVHGEDDRVVSVRQSRAMHRRLSSSALPHEYLELKDGDHFLSRGDNRMVFAQAAADFLNTALRPQSGAAKKPLAQ